MTNYTIRPLKNNELSLLEDFLYYAIFVPEGVDAPPREIINLPELQVYIRNFSTQPHDHCLVAELDGVVVGAVWVRDMPDYGHVAVGVPSFAVVCHLASARISRAGDRHKTDAGNARPSATSWLCKSLIVSSKSQLRRTNVHQTRLPHHWRKRRGIYYGV